MKEPTLEQHVDERRPRLRASGSNVRAHGSFVSPHGVDVSAALHSATVLRNDPNLGPSEGEFQGYFGAAERLAGCRPCTGYPDVEPLERLRTHHLIGKGKKRAKSTKRYLGRVFAFEYERRSFAQCRVIFALLTLHLPAVVTG